MILYDELLNISMIIRFVDMVLLTICLTIYLIIYIFYNKIAIFTHDTDNYNLDIYK